MRPEKSLQLGRTAFESEKWKDALTYLSNADSEDPLQGDDLELSAVSAYLTGAFNACNSIWTRAHNAYLERGDIPGAVRCAFWLGFVLLNKGDTVRGGGWIAHARKLLDEEPVDCVEKGYLFLPAALACLAKGETDRSIEAFNHALKTGNHFRDHNLRTLAHLGHGQALIRSGEPQKGVAFLDEAMVAVESGGLSPIVMGIVYCAVIEASLEIFDVRRAGEWTHALSHWCSSHPQLVPFRGQCLIRRSEIMRVQGEWNDAIAEVSRAIELLSKPTPEPATASAFYQLGELHRLRGAYTEAEQAYCEANKLGRNPQPGLALLRMAQGQIERSKSSIRNALTDAKKLKDKCDALFASTEIMLADENIENARASLDKLKEVTHSHEAPFLQALAAQAEGAVLLGEGDPNSAIEKLRSAREIWAELKAPYEGARARSLIAMAYIDIGDEDAARMEYEGAKWVFQQLKAAPDIARIEAHFNVEKSKAIKDLTHRETQVLHLIAEGKSNKSVADKLFISERTVERHVSNIFIKLEVASRTEAAALAYKHKLL